MPFKIAITYLNFKRPIKLKQQTRIFIKYSPSLPSKGGQICFKNVKISPPPEDFPFSVVILRRMKRMKGGFAELTL